MDNAQSDELAIYEIMTNERRRIAFECLVKRGPALSLGELADEVASRESGESPPPQMKRRSVYTALTRDHLPKLESLGILEFDTESNEVVLNKQALQLYLEVVPRHELSWAEYYLALGVLGLATIALAAVGAPGIDHVSPTVWAIGYFAAFIASAAVQLRSRHRRLLGKFAS